MNTLHYIFDPMCGWCYGAAPLINAARQTDLNIQLHAGGMWTGTNIKHVTPQLRQFVMTNDARIGQITGQTFGSAYFDDLLNDTSAILDSEPPIRAIIAAQNLGASGLDMLHHIQQAHFIHGQHVARFETLSSIAQDLGLALAAFRSAYDAVDLNTETRQTHALMSAYGAQGYPTMLLERNGQTQRIDHSPFYGNAAQFGVMLGGIQTP